MEVSGIMFGVLERPLELCEPFSRCRQLEVIFDFYHLSPPEIQQEDSSLSLVAVILKELVEVLATRPLYDVQEEINTHTSSSKPARHQTHVDADRTDPGRCLSGPSNHRHRPTLPRW